MYSSIQTTARLLVLALALVGATASVHADEYQDVNQLINAGRLGEAMAKADAFLATKPADPQMRFLKGVLQRNAGRIPEAIAIFTKLTEDYPALSEPYNNLAVIYAGQSQFDKARAALEMAIRANPGYATAHENLGDVYMRLASQTYSKALELDTNNAVIPGKLALIREVNKVNANSPAPVAARAEPAPASAAPKPYTTSSAANKPENEIEKAVLAWAKAWSTQDVAAYLAAYGKEFTPTGGKSRAAWAQERKERIGNKSGITVSVGGLNVKVMGNRAIATFRQNYRSDTLNETSRKSLEMKKVGDQWLIVRETLVR
jgi:tetratricopeptide (TPR) repeat protein